MSKETLTIEVSWPASLAVPEGSTIDLQLWAGNEQAGYSMIDGEFSTPATTSPATLEISYDSQDLQSQDGTTTWEYFHTSPRLVQGGFIKNIAHAEKISVAQTKGAAWKMALR
ncbi:MULTISPECIES: hypothetical protein [Pseudomonas]|uniref:hypothetical protein n=1 Tax=Pseudomonas TaxID=286 RepID=UPI001F517EF3|nr:hypothetical protein [Pseudomonas putida]MCI0912952.1 hypothetical protein [Pseudomonas putida]WAB99174.1 hypothetical protein OSW16_05815 [Pseudomonas putida]